MKTENQAKYTSGPWKVGGWNEVDNTLTVGIPISFSGMLSAVAYIAPRPFYHDDQEANAHLIAAAPELLEACKIAKVTFDEYKKLTGKRAKALVALEVAIAKAEGGR